MYIFKSGSYEFEVKDFIKTQDTIIMDFSFSEKTEMEKFIDFYDKNINGDRIFEFEISGMNFSGKMGSLIYDKYFDVRLYIWHDNFEIGKSKDIFICNLLTALNNNKNAMRGILCALERQNIVIKKDFDKIINYLPENDYGNEMFRQVENLQLYLKDMEITLDDFRRDENSIE